MFRFVVFRDTGCFEGGRDGGVGDGILTRNDITIGEADRDVMGEVCIDGWEYGGVAWYGADAGEEVDGGFKRAGEESCAACVRLPETVDLLRQRGCLPSQKEITNTCTRVVKAGRRSASLDDFVGYDVEE